MKKTLISPKYLKQYGHSIDVSLWPKKMNHQYVLILPVCGETIHCLTQVLKNHQHTSLLLILVVNRPTDHERNTQWQAENQQLIDHLIEQSTQQIDLGCQHLLLQQKNAVNILLLDFNDQGFDKSQGVGLARKIGADTALQLILLNFIKSTWLFNTDADVTLPPDYFAVVDNVPFDCSALCLKFNHVGNETKADEFQQLYDFKLHYYQQGVRFIGAKYDYIPLGSTLVVNASAYAQVRGFPIRSGAEDFYILNKLAKIGQVVQPNTPVIDIQVRFSDRVPFGTGPGIEKIKQLNDAGNEPLFYHPAAFHVLKAWRSGLIGYYHQAELPVDDLGLNVFWQIRSVLEKAKQQCKSIVRWRQFIHEWFDAFKILKSVHFLMAEMQGLKLSELIGLSAYKVITEEE